MTTAGTTEHGSVDPLSNILEVRKYMEKKGMSFMIHVDAAWGGYFAIKAKPKAMHTGSPEPECAFSMELNHWSYNQLSCLKQAE
jgi:glutamate/tyrosine decarboxylase-like PLP-dependent enzyme